LKKGFKDSSKAARVADPGITQAATLKTLIKFLRNAAFRSLWFLAVFLSASSRKMRDQDMLGSYNMLVTHRHAAECPNKVAILKHKMN
jgi:hypothetical protein